MTDLFVIDVSVRSGQGHVVLAARGAEPTAETLVTLHFPLEAPPPGSPPEREERLVRDAQALLRQASHALRER